MQITLGEDGRVAHAGVALTAAGPRPVRVDAAEKLLLGQLLTEDVIRAASEEARAVSDPFADTRGSVEYKKTWPACSSRAAFAPAPPAWARE